MGDGHKRHLTGRVHSDKMDKTVVVEVRRRVKDTQYKKIIQRRARYKAHDANNSAHVGDMVKIIESKPMSKEKRWALVEVLEKSA